MKGDLSMKQSNKFVPKKMWLPEWSCEHEMYTLHQIYTPREVVA